MVTITFITSLCMATTKGMFNVQRSIVITVQETLLLAPLLLIERVSVYVSNTNTYQVDDIMYQDGHSTLSIVVWMY